MWIGDVHSSFFNNLRGCWFLPIRSGNGFLTQNTEVWFVWWNKYGTVSLLLAKRPAPLYIEYIGKVYITVYVDSRFLTTVSEPNTETCILTQKKGPSLVFINVKTPTCSPKYSTSRQIWRRILSSSESPPATSPPACVPRSLARFRRFRLSSILCTELSTSYVSILNL